MSELNVSVDFNMRYYALYDHMFYLELGVVNADGTISQTPTGTLNGINLFIYIVIMIKFVITKRVLIS